MNINLINGGKNDKNRKISKVGRLYQADNSYLCGDEGTQGSPHFEIWQTIRRQNEDKVKYPPRSGGKGLQTTPLHTGEDAVVAEERGVQMRGGGFCVEWSEQSERTRSTAELSERQFVITNGVNDSGAWSNNPRQGYKQKTRGKKK